VPINPNDFSTEIDNPYFSLEPGTTYIYQSPDGSEVTRFEVTRDTIDIEVAPGVFVTCVVVKDTVTLNGKLHEVTLDYFAQHKDGSVWYFGEDVQNYDKSGKTVINTDGSWLAGVDGAEPGIIMLADPQPGAEYNQENAPGVAQDHAEVISLTGSIDDVPYLEGSIDSLLQIEETTPLDPTALEHKYYASGIGQVAVVDPSTGETLEQLVKIRFDGTEQSDTIIGKIGADELFGYGGNDSLSGMAGKDWLDGGLGKDTLSGGDGADRLIGGRGDDTLSGGSGDDIFEFARGFGRDRITDFGDSAGNEDVIQFAKAIFKNFSALSGAMEQAGADVVITGTGSDVLTIKNVKLASLGADDFLFV
jgi:hypothetical protein